MIQFETYCLDLKRRAQLSLVEIRSVFEQHETNFSGMVKRIYGMVLSGEEVEQALRDWQSKMTCQRNDEHSRMSNALARLNKREWFTRCVDSFGGVKSSSNRPEGRR